MPSGPANSDNRRPVEKKLVDTVSTIPIFQKMIPISMQYWEDLSPDEANRLLDLVLNSRSFLTQQQIISDNHVDQAPSDDPRTGRNVVIRLQLCRLNMLRAKLVFAGESSLFTEIDKCEAVCPCYGACPKIYDAIMAIVGGDDAEQYERIEVGVRHVA